MLIKRNCAHCGAPIIWLDTASGKMMPCNPKAVYYRYNPHGKGRVLCEKYRQVFACDILNTSLGSDGIGYVSHFATCPKADECRKRKPERQKLEGQMRFEMS